MSGQQPDPIGPGNPGGKTDRRGAGGSAADTPDTAWVTSGAAMQAELKAGIGKGKGKSTPKMKAAGGHLKVLAQPKKKAAPKKKGKK